MPIAGIFACSTDAVSVPHPHPPHPPLSLRNYPPSNGCNQLVTTRRPGDRTADRTVLSRERRGFFAHRSPDGNHGCRGGAGRDRFPAPTRGEPVGPDEAAGRSGGTGRVDGVAGHPLRRGRPGIYESAMSTDGVSAHRTSEPQHKAVQVQLVPVPGPR
jgi:hypothetical protein